MHDLYPRDETRAERIGGLILATLFAPPILYTLWCLLTIERWPWE